MQNERISGYQLSVLYIGFLLGSSVIMNVSFGAARDAWLAYLIGWASGFILLAVYLYLIKLHPTETLIDILRLDFGKYLGSVIGLLYVWYFVHISALILRNFSEFMVTVIYPETPLSFILIIFLAVLIYALKNGLEVFVRLVEVLVPILLVIMFITTIFLISEFDLTELFPALEFGIFPILAGAFRVNAFPFGEVIVFLMMHRNVNNKKVINKVSYNSFLIAGGILFLTTVREILILGPDLVQRSVYPTVISAKMFPSIDIDPFLAVDLLIAGEIKIGICIYGAIVGLAQIFNLDDYYFLINPIGIITMALSIWVYESALEALTWVEEIFPYYTIPFQIIIPLLLLIISLIRERRNSKRTTS